MNIQLRHIRSFIAVAAERSYARAAERLAVSQPALSQTIMQLEQTLGFAVFDRTTRSVNLTKNGELLLEKSAKLNRALDGFFADIKILQQSVTNKVRLGCLIGTAVELMPDIVREFEQRRPNATLELVEFDFNHPDAGLATHAVDCAIFRPPTDTKDIQIVELARERCVVCLPDGHMLARQDTVSVTQFIDETFVAAPGSGSWRDYWLANQYRNGQPPKVSFEAPTVDSELQAVATRKGISITSESTAKFYARPGVVFRPISDMDPCVIAIGFRDFANPLVRELVDIVSSVASRQFGRPAAA